MLPSSGPSLLDLQVPLSVVMKHSVSREYDVILTWAKVLSALELHSTGISYHQMLSRQRQYL